MPISPDLRTVLRRLKLSRVLDTLPDRLTLARQQQMPPHDLLLLVLSDEVARRDSLGDALRVRKARLCWCSSRIDHRARRQLGQRPAHYPASMQAITSSSDAPVWSLLREQNWLVLIRTRRATTVRPSA
jgi:hypothetical protein